MALMKERRIVDVMRNNPNIKCCRVITSSKNFENRFDGSINYFFQTLKNSLQSINGVSNREYFKKLSGSYFSIEDTSDFEIIIIYDTTFSKPTELQLKMRLKKLLGNQITIEFGDFPEFQDRIEDMIGIVRKSQLFGDYYKKGVDKV
jgi:hypothetical protein